MFDQEFFPTPRSVGLKMKAKISDSARHFLEPNAGKGDLAEVFQNFAGYGRKLQIDCIEQSPELCLILEGKENLSIVGYDWLTFDGVCYYDAIVMNPPFSNGDAHLLKAWDFLHDGEIVCLLNEDTIKNPYTAERKRLVAIIEQHGNVEYLGDCFKTAERKTEVNVALVYLKKESDDDTVDLWASDTPEKDVRDDIDQDGMLAIQDRLGNMQRYYDEANNHMFKAFKHIRKASVFMEANGVSLKRADMDEIFRMAQSNTNPAKAEFTRAHRNLAWHEVFSQTEFHKMLDKKQRDKFLRDIDRHGNIPFTVENIKGTLRNLVEQRQMLFEQSVANIFDDLTRYYAGNTSHKEGWKTNDNFKVNKKIVFPYGCTFEKHSAWRQFHMHYGHRMDIYNDLDRVLCVMQRVDFDKCRTIGDTMSKKFSELGSGVKSPFDNECQSDFFDIKFYMKGTVHLKFRDDKLWEIFNKTAAAGKAWLGKV